MGICNTSKVIDDVEVTKKRKKKKNAINKPSKSDRRKGERVKAPTEDIRQVMKHIETEKKFERDIDLTKKLNKTWKSNPRRRRVPEEVRKFPEEVRKNYEIQGFEKIRKVNSETERVYSLRNKKLDPVVERCKIDLLYGSFPRSEGTEALYWSLPPDFELSPEERREEKLKRGGGSYEDIYGSLTVGRGRLRPNQFLSLAHSLPVLDLEDDEDEKKKKKQKQGEQGDDNKSSDENLEKTKKTEPYLKEEAIGKLRKDSVDSEKTIHDPEEKKDPKMEGSAPIIEVIGETKGGSDLIEQERKRKKSDRMKKIKEQMKNVSLSVPDGDSLPLGSPSRTSMLIGSEDLALPGNEMLGLTLTPPTPMFTNLENLEEEEEEEKEEKEKEKEDIDKDFEKMIEAFQDLTDDESTLESSTCETTLDERTASDERTLESSESEGEMEEEEEEEGEEVESEEEEEGEEKAKETIQKKKISRPVQKSSTMFDTLHEEKKKSTKKNSDFKRSHSSEILNLLSSDPTTYGTRSYQAPTSINVLMRRKRIRYRITETTNGEVKYDHLSSSSSSSSSSKKKDETTTTTIVKSSIFGKTREERKTFLENVDNNLRKPKVAPWDRLRRVGRVNIATSNSTNNSDLPQTRRRAMSAFQKPTKLLDLRRGLYGRGKQRKKFSPSQYQNRGSPHGPSPLASGEKKKSGGGDISPRNISGDLSPRTRSTSVGELEPNSDDSSRNSNSSSSSGDLSPSSIEDAIINVKRGRGRRRGGSGGGGLKCENTPFSTRTPVVNRNRRFSIKYTKTIETKKVTKKETDEKVFERDEKGVMTPRTVRVVRYNNYYLIERIGSGSQASVHLCGHTRSDQRFAVKCISRHSLIRAARNMMLRGRRSFQKKKNSSGGGGDGGDDDDEETPLTKLQREISILKKVRYKHVVQLVEVMDDPSLENTFLVLEYMEGGPLLHINPYTGEMCHKFSEEGATRDEIKKKEPFSEALARYYFKQIILGVRYIHKCGIVHRDIKPANILLSKDLRILKISDFGMSDFIHNRSEYGDTTVAFLAPEFCGYGSAFGSIRGLQQPQKKKKKKVVYKKMKKNNMKKSSSVSDEDSTESEEESEEDDYSTDEITSESEEESEESEEIKESGMKKSQSSQNMGMKSPEAGVLGDIWALGVTLYIMVVGELPFYITHGGDGGVQHHVMMNMHKMIVHDEVEFPPEKHLSEDLKDLIMRLLEKDRNKRISIQEVMNHPWVKFKKEQLVADEECVDSGENIWIYEDEDEEDEIDFMTKEMTPPTDLELEMAISERNHLTIIDRKFEKRIN